MAINFSQLANSLGAAIENIGTASAQATARANAISAQAQSAQGAFNQQSANQANMLNENAMLRQFGFNSAQAAQANQFTQNSWEQAAAFNRELWLMQAEFNREEAQKNRDWQERMSNTQYQRAMADMQKAGLNPILAYSQGGAGVPGGAQATVGGAQMSSAQGAMASGGLLSANSANMGNYTGIAENMGTTLSLIGAIFGGISSAYQASGGLGDVGGDILGEITDAITGQGDYEGSWWDKATDKMADTIKKGANTVKNWFGYGKHGYNAGKDKTEGSKTWHFSNPLPY